MSNQFETITLQHLNDESAESLDTMPFGIIGFGPDYVVNIYNAVESSYAGLTVNRVVGRNLFEEVAPCMNNFMVAQRFADEAEIDAVIPYVLTLRMRPTPVRLRMIKSLRSEQRFLLVDRQVAT